MRTLCDTHENAKGLFKQLHERKEHTEGKLRDELRDEFHISGFHGSHCRFESPTELPSTDRLI